MADAGILEKSSGFGIKLINALVDQFDGSIRLERGGGTTFVIDFAQ